MWHVSPLFVLKLYLLKLGLPRLTISSFFSLYVHTFIHIAPPLCSLRYNKRLQAGMAGAVKSPAARGMQSPARLLGTPGSSSSSSSCDDLASASSQAVDAKQSLRRVQQFLDRFNAKH
jgi:hypothetical protein